MKKKERRTIYISDRDWKKFRKKSIEKNISATKRIENWVIEQNKK